MIRDLGLYGLTQRTPPPSPTRFKPFFTYIMKLVGQFYGKCWYFGVLFRSCVNRSMWNENKYINNSSCNKKNPNAYANIPNLNNSKLSSQLRHLWFLHGQSTHLEFLARDSTTKEFFYPLCLVVGHRYVNQNTKLYQISTSSSIYWFMNATNG